MRISSNEPELLLQAIVAAVEKGVLLACGADGRCVGSVAMEAEIRGLWPCRGGVACSLAGGRFSRVELSVD